MRHVKFTKRVYNAETHKWNEEQAEGTFLAWGIDYEDLGDRGAGHFSAALIETESGDVELIPATSVCFMWDQPND